MTFLNRRALLAGAGGLLLTRAGGGRANVTIMLVPGWNQPPELPGPAISFTRAYAACPTLEAAKRTLVSGRFPHLAPGPIDSRIQLIFRDDASSLIRSNNDDDIFVLTAAHGGESEDQPYEGSAHIPLYIRYPRVIHESRSEDVLISHADVLPTLLGLQGLEVRSEIHGRDLSRLIRGGNGTRPESIYCEGKLDSPDEWRMVVRGLDKMVVNRSFEVTHLYNLGQDPHERENLAFDLAHELRRDELKALIREWMRRSEDRMDASGLKRRVVY